MERLRILTAESVVTMDPAQPVAEAVLLRGGAVERVGTRGELQHLAPEAPVVDLPGATVVPGLVESHVHPGATAMTSASADCRSPRCTSIADIHTALAERLTLDSGWVRGWGYDDTLLAEMRHPTRDDLDRVHRDRPIVLTHISGHFAVANSRALELAGVSEGTVDPDEAGFPRHPEGRLTGLLQGMPAMGRVFAHVPRPTVGQVRDGIRAFLRDATAQGVTTVHDLGVGLNAGLEELTVYRGLDAAGELPLHVVGFLRGDLVLDAAPGELPFAESTASAGRFRLAGAKVWADGSIQGLTAALRFPYHCRPEHRGELGMDARELARVCARAADAGAQVAVHANGDAAVEATVAALAPLQRNRADELAPHRIEHCQVSTAEDLDAIRTAGLGVSFFVNHVYHWGDRHRSMFLGPDRADDLDPLAWADGRGQLFGMHSDCPVTPLDPLRTIWTAVSRRTRDGSVLGGHQRLTVHRALQAMTTDSHWLVGDHRRVGALRAGQRADLVAVDTALLDVDEDGLRNARASAVMVEGDWAVAP
ncbi:amidohydrolase [Blastococcus goldschmidtiae]|uniref:Amidohydrolase n=1 Tax=Blastococcus goldschmidtiae TaxID=3075546 RepID=A0ABU2K6W5_9ACTN|nr:amidohydrolase [Blastococcus sp. DSM 46792]MDT0275925.1 amidohydrolase [Blastococcus sp. DSM 46792]